MESIMRIGAVSSESQHRSLTASLRDDTYQL